MEIIRITHASRLDHPCKVSPSTTEGICLMVLGGCGCRIMTKTSHAYWVRMYVGGTREIFGKQPTPTPTFITILADICRGLAFHRV